MDDFRAFNNIDIFAWQIVCDLLELNILKTEENSSVVLGAGSPGSSPTASRPTSWTSTTSWGRS